MCEENLQRRPTVVTLGFVALDIVFGLEDPLPRFYAGGTSGNVAAGLSFLDWQVLAIARLSGDVAGDLVRRDLARWRVCTEYLGLSPAAPTPIVLEKIELSKNGFPRHRFLWTCPDCGAYFPPFRAVIRNSMGHITSKVAKADVFFADRVSRATIELAKHLRARGAMIYFEPSATCDAKLFREMLKTCDVLKYSAQRARSFSELLREHTAQLEIETLGEDGLRFRTKRAPLSWHQIPGYEIKVRDTAGSGDWTTVGLISSLFKKGRADLESLTIRQIHAALKHSQAMAALNCQYEGARGVMYQLSRERFLEAAGGIASRKTSVRKERKISLSGHLSTSDVCPSCAPRATTKSDKKSAVDNSRQESNSPVPLEAES